MSTVRTQISPPSLASDIPALRPGHRRAVDQRGEAPPAGVWHGIGEDAGGVGLDDLIYEGIGRRADRAVVAPRNLYGREWNGRTVVADNAAKDVAGPKPVRPDQRLDLHGQADQGVPALFRSEGVDDDLGVMDDQFFFGRLPVRRRLEKKT